MAEEPKTAWVDFNGKPITNMDIACACREGAAALFGLAERSDGKMMKGEFQRYANILQVVGEKFKELAKLIEKASKK